MASSQQTVAVLELSGEELKIGWFDEDDTISIHAFGQAEPTYMSAAEAEMVITALRVAITKIQGDR